MGLIITVFLFGGFLTGALIDFGVLDADMSINQYVFVFFTWYIVLPVFVGYCIVNGYKDFVDVLEEYKE